MDKMKKLEILNQQLTLKLQIPRTHMIFLKENGKLDEFVEAKILGKEPVAKWLLLDSYKREIDNVQEKQKKKEDERLAAEAKNQ